MPRSDIASVSECTFGVQRLAPREGQQLAHQIGGAVGILLDVHDIGESRVGGPHLGQQQIGKADDRRQHIVEVMGDAGGKLAHRLHLLALRQLQFQRLALGLVDGEHHHRAFALGELGEGELHDPRPCRPAPTHRWPTSPAPPAPISPSALQDRRPLAFGHHIGQHGAALGLRRQRQERRIGVLDPALRHRPRQCRAVPPK